ncbi:hypothetical protein [Gordonia paraffinivorans]|uniref:hypothetical protein n=1 Tax=Gordonia paraffinivorans TaxID=175628 RepID=UPI00104173D3|nr:hypothetical protein [Gordonia paraffinivorans]MCD2145115.1 hypothetical protein [Gordonia paraffinivorans]
MTSGHGHEAIVGPRRQATAAPVPGPGHREPRTPAYFAPPPPAIPPVEPASRRPPAPPRRIADAHLRSATAGNGSDRGNRMDPAVVISALVMIGLAVAVIVGLLTN